MGRFESTAETYLRYREPYPPAFFAAVAKRLDLAGKEALIDLGTGPGVLALGFRPYVGSILGVDPEPSMLEMARANAAEADMEFPLIFGRTEDLPADIGPFDLITVGRALHWMDRPATIAVFDRILGADGSILICSASPEKQGANDWHETFETVSRSWGTGRGSSWRAVYEGWFDETPFEPEATIETLFTQPITPEDLFERALTRSSTSPAILGGRIEACRIELLSALAPYFPQGVRDETLAATANVFRRRI